MSEADILGQLVSLAEDLYGEGYVCGISGKHSLAWYLSWAEAMRRVAAGEPYTQNLVIDIFNERR
jgi:hypothetical protein